MIRVYTKTRHVDSIHKFLDLINLEHEIFTTKNPPSPEHELEPFDLGVSYSYPRKITKNLLSIPPKGFVNYHAAPPPAPPRQTTGLGVPQTALRFGVGVAIWYRLQEGSPGMADSVHGIAGELGKFS